MQGTTATIDIFCNNYLHISCVCTHTLTHFIPLIHSSSPLYSQHDYQCAFYRVLLFCIEHGFPAWSLYFSLHGITHQVVFQSSWNNTSRCLQKKKKPTYYLSDSRNCRFVVWGLPILCFPCFLWRACQTTQEKDFLEDVATSAPPFSLDVVAKCFLSSSPQQFFVGDPGFTLGEKYSVWWKQLLAKIWSTCNIYLVAHKMSQAYMSTKFTLVEHMQREQYEYCF